MTDAYLQSAGRSRGDLVGLVATDASGGAHSCSTAVEHLFGRKCSATRSSAQGRLVV